MKKFLAITLPLIFLVLFTSCLKSDDKALKQLEEDELRPVSSIVLSEEDARRLNEKLPVTLYFSNQDGTRLVNEIRYINMEDAKQGTEQLASVLVKELVKGPSSSELKPTIPEGASLRSPVKIEGRTAIVDMTKEFVDNHPGGKEAEEITIFSIVNTLTELKDIETVKFLINGKEQKEFKGNFRFDNAFPRNESLIDRKQSFTVLPEDDGLFQDEAQETGATETYDEDILED
ncbi:lipoprotein LpqB, GerMN domain-containing [Thermoclostridium stercorarium subsp. stercorarium DSM 8532]|jgi:germination protein M|uniref:Lipoprotein LpqB, GerMN domain-containing n=3 Tax=Thermoclostridium stercorarium TaxID=1510 RepID=L7VRS8_THES1|nr:GerMN domain-containing protein [Thermoclostridium stercorarium]AGC69492.1 lipoprotein LpqB, GerMN domain-containing [Thermoclostridium stercorarium subsp. stercorarium DSM 8532]AGI40445.1 sporulation protein [Thermoclostridium stercorarium subsp. stercorarium DSM 8532]ANW99733.1 spore gernimation protein GerMN [Thermoclostridium stercorarium subsp. thermolacticum DSM 2910]ANX02359.1 spore gernimation protein GerMN [Thermoclostridium stercorarium subsp. leptospartum DSM 9219]UZQ85437.1 GerM